MLSVCVANVVHGNSQIPTHFTTANPNPNPSTDAKEQWPGTMTTALVFEKT